MDLNALLTQIKSHLNYAKIGMVLFHQGVVRATSRDGRPVTGLRVSVDQIRLEKVIAEQKERDGIVDILVQINADRDLKVGDDVMALVVAGDVRENVISVLSDTIDAIKSQVTRKTEFYA